LAVLQMAPSPLATQVSPSCAQSSRTRPQPATQPTRVSPSQEPERPGGHQVASWLTEAQASAAAQSLLLPTQST
jgi:hypothetical protein